MRRPARIERAGALTPRDRMWAAIRGFGLNRPFSPAEIEIAAEQQWGAVKSYLRGLVAGGFVREYDGDGPRHAVRLRHYCLARDVGVEAPRVNDKGELVTQGRSQQQMWNALRKARGAVDWRWLVIHGSTEECVIQKTAAMSYLRDLARGGYLSEGEKGRAGAPSAYAFVRARNTGGRPPLVCRDGSVMDANSGRQMAPAGGAR